MSELKQLISKIVSKDAYIDHTVLDGGLCIILVRVELFDTTKGWWLYDGTSWHPVDDKLALEYCKRYWHPARYEEMLLAPTWQERDARIRNNNNGIPA